eukprot:gnl/MRDRNA2_/MRDRNA2_74701_c0_seq1.p1 gnl/MRDRNA2_/MRDRNA2_74701_c0~~gnl/MRDRNA2_/MRDRNA2_74701_c0_seq1.p1  ORF type:complete len:570 (-),score=102.77 gnl/MRDRNA2_/MRDRNA2_74701_c0_seq1:148-1605(-)
MVPLGSRQRRWCAVPLPRLVRFLCRQIATSPAQTVNAVELWIKCVWWPLILALKQTGAEHTCGIPLLQALIAAVEAMSVAGENASGSLLAFLPDPLKQNMAAEISWSLSLILEIWSMSTNAESAGAPVKYLHKLQAEAQNLVSDLPADTVDSMGIAAHQAIVKRRSVIQQSLAGFGIDAAHVAVITTETLRVRQSNMFLVEQKREETLPSPLVRRRAAVKTGTQGAQTGPGSVKAAPASKTPPAKSGKRPRMVPDDDDSENDDVTPRVQPLQNSPVRMSREFPVPVRLEQSLEMQQVVPLQDTPKESNSQTKGRLSYEFVVPDRLQRSPELQVVSQHLDDAQWDGQLKAADVEDDSWETEDDFDNEHGSQWIKADTEDNLTETEGDFGLDPPGKLEDCKENCEPENHICEKSASAFPFPLKKECTSQDLGCSEPIVKREQEETEDRPSKRPRLHFHDFVDGLGRQASRILKMAPWGRETNIQREH